MTVTHVRKDPEALTMTITNEYDASIARVWELWQDPRLLERWWGPPTYPATVEDHDLSPGGRVTYFMTGPEGDRHRGFWKVVAVDPPRHLEFQDGFADETGAENHDMPVTVTRVSLDEQSGRHTRMVIETTFASAEDMDRLVSMGMDEGMREALGQTDDLVGAGAWRK